MKEVKDPSELVKMGIATEMKLRMIRTTTDRGHNHMADVDDQGNGKTTTDQTGHVHTVRNWIALPAGAGPHTHRVPH